MDLYYLVANFFHYLGILQMTVFQIKYKLLSMALWRLSQEHDLKFMWT